MPLSKFRPTYERNVERIKELEKTLIDSKAALEEVKYTSKMLVQRNEVLVATIHEQEDFVKLYDAFSLTMDKKSSYSEQSGPVIVSPEPSVDNQLFILSGKGYKNRFYDATLKVENGIFYIMKGSMISSVVSSSKTSLAPKHRERYAELIDKDYITLEDIPFESLKEAATFVKGTAGKGWKEWVPFDTERTQRVIQEEKRGDERVNE